MSTSHLDLFVTRTGDGAIELSLDGLGHVHHSYGVVTFEQDQYDHFSRFLKDIETLDATGDEAEHRLRARGTRLFRKLLPPSLQETLLGLAQVGLALQIVSEDASIPWECLCFPGERGEDGVEGLFWGEALAITRLPRGRAPEARLILRRLAWVENRSDDLPDVASERQAIQDSWGEQLEIVPVAARYLDITDRMATGRFDAWHFACHGAATGDDADSWYLQLEDGRRLSPDELPSDAEAMRSSRPLVFMNACESGRTGLSLAGLGGWAPNLLNLGAGAFIAPLWSVRNRQAMEFSAEVYGHLAEGRTIGEAARLARRARPPGDPNRLAYVVFAHPTARVLLAQGAANPDEGEPEEETVDDGERDDPADRRPVRRGRRSAVVSGTSVARRSEKGILHRDDSLLLPVPGGSYPMGTDDPDLPEEWGPRHLVRLSPFWIAEFPVTNRQYERFLAENSGHPAPEFWQHESFNGPDKPVVGVSWHDARAYCRWAGLELPTEAQWEAAARGQDGRYFPWGDDDPEPDRANYGRKVGGTTARGDYPKGRGPFGTLDQAGNVWEWCLDVWESFAYRYRGSQPVNPVCRGEGRMRVVRGGSWINHWVDARADFREGSASNLSQNQLGFRCVWNPPVDS